MHDLFITHLPHSQQNSMNDSLNLVAFKFVFSLDFIVQTSSTEQFKDYVERVLGLKYLEQPHVVWMSQVPHDFDFLDQALFSFLLAVSSLFRKSFHCVPGLIFMLFDQIDRCEVSLSDFVKGLELFVKSSLIQSKF